MNNFEELDDQDLKAPKALKNMLTAEIDVIRDVLGIFSMFTSEAVQTGIKFIQEFENDNPKNE